MLSELYFYFFVGICLALAAWGLSRPERIYQYPFFMGVINIIFVLPQAVALIDNPGVVSQTALERVLLMACLCALMCWVGYKAKPNDKLLHTLDIKLDDNKLLKAAIFLSIIGLIFGLLTSNEAKNVTGAWSGSVVIYLFFSQVIYLGFSIFLFRLLKHPSLLNFLGIFITIIPIIQTVLAGRRQPTVTFLVMVGTIFWIVRRLAPPRLLVAMLLVAGIYLIPVIGLLRGDFWTLIFYQDWATLISASQDALNLLLKGNILELRNAALAMDAADYKGQYQFGTEYWDALVSQYVPRQFVGEEFKKSLMFNLENKGTLLELYGYVAPTGATSTGIADSYLQFGYFGSLVFALIGYFFKSLWVSAVEQKSIISTLLMISLISPAMLGVTHGTTGLLPALVFYGTVVSLVAYYARSKSPVNNKIEKLL